MARKSRKHLKLAEYAARNGAGGPDGWCMQTGEMVHRHRRHGAEAGPPLK